MDLRDLKKFLFVRVLADSVLHSIMRISPDDPRIYPYYEPEAVIDGTRKAYITFALTANPERTAAIRNPTFTLAIWAIDWDVAHIVRDRLAAIFDCSGDRARTMTTPAGVTVAPELIAEHDSAQENTKFKGMQLTFRIGQSAV